MVWEKRKVQKKQRYSGGTWIDVVPSETRAVEVITTYDELSGCSGYNVKYRDDILDSYVCSTCPPIYRTTTAETCSNGNKYMTTTITYSNDIGETWSTSSTTKTLIEANSPDCGYSARTISTGTVCSGVSNYDLYQVNEHQETRDSGTTWTTTSTTYTLIEERSVTCGAPMYRWVNEPISEEGYRCSLFNGKVLAYGRYNDTFGYYDSEGWVTAACDATSAVTSSDICFPDDYSVCKGYDSFTDVDAYFGPCVKTISAGTLNCNSIENYFYLRVHIPDNVKTIGNYCFVAGNGKGTSRSSLVAYIGSGVTSIGQYSFRSGEDYTCGEGVEGSVTIHIKATTPPSLGANSIGLVCPNSSRSYLRVFVPSGSVQTYKTHSDWSRLSSHICAETTTWSDDIPVIYYREKEQVSSNSGQTWTDTGNYRNSNNIYMVSEVGCIPTERWVESGTCCVDYDKHKKISKQISFKNSYGWITTNQYSAGTLVEANSPDCGYPFNGKFRAAYSGGATTYSATCDSSTELTTATTKPSGYDYNYMTSAVIGDCITSLGADVFRSCNKLASVVIPDNITSIGDYAFANCQSLTDIYIPNTVTSIGNHAFHGCDGITSINIPSGVTSIGDYTFYSCENLMGVVIPSGVTSIGEYAFASMDSLSNLIIPDNVTSIGHYVFRDCSGLTSCIIGNGVTSIESNAFSGCTNLTSVTLGSGVTSIGNNAFNNCRKFASLTIKNDTPPTLGNEVFGRTLIGIDEGYIYVPSGSVDTYKSASGWSSYSSRIKAIGS